MYINLIQIPKLFIHKIISTLYKTIRKIVITVNVQNIIWIKKSKNLKNTAN